MSDFSNKRDNPLFLSGESSPPEGNGVTVPASKKLSADGDWSKIESNRIGGAKSGGGSGGVGSFGDDKRGRSASRNLSNPSGIGQSVSRGRARSVSQRPVSRRPASVSSEVWCILLFSALHFVQMKLEEKNLNLI